MTIVSLVAPPLWLRSSRFFRGTTATSDSKWLYDPGKGAGSSRWFVLVKFTLNLFVDTVSASFVYGLHQLPHLANLLITHFVHKIHVQFLSPPVVSFKLLAILLPLGKKANDVQGVLDVFVSTELGLEIRVAEDPLFS